MSRGGRHNIIGSNAGIVPPAWRTTTRQTADSKILISSLPQDVKDTEIEELFRKTVGPVKEVVAVYNNQGSSRGIAIVTFHRKADALVAQQKYDGKFVDGRRPLKIEIVSEAADSLAVRQPVSLFDRIAPPNHMLPRQAAAIAQPPTGPRRQKKGPKRIQKRLARASKAQLDKDMDDYRAAS